MSKHLTNTVASKQKPTDKPYEVRDTELKGLLLRIQPSGVKTYYLEYSRGKRLRIGPADALSPDQAREKARKELAGLCLTGEDPAEKRKRVRAENYLQFLDDVYKPWLDLNLVHGQVAYDTLKKGFPELHKLSLSEITPGAIEKWRSRRLHEGISPNTINRQLSDLRACLNRAREIWGCLDTNPLAKVKPSKADNSPKVRYLTPDEEAQLRAALDDREEELRAGRDSGNQWRAIRGYEEYASLRSRAFTDHLKPAVLLSLNTGLRRGELLKLKWEDVSFELRILTVTGKTSKTGKTRHIPLNDESLKLLQRWKEQPGVKSLNQCVFTGPGGEQLQGMKTSWRRVLRQARITGFRWHDLRHTFASKLVMASVNLNTVRELMGHSDYKMTLRYAHLAPEHKLEAVQKLAVANGA